ncbi:phosphoesterase [Clostridium aceticum]|uniref:Phosphoesterase n=1 Tax=Clostridium aceticum TaxID=84022 RepID=A0A0D8IDT3_9CLOT|nr:metallophosphoesterase [Clostridium aceticum]AKL96492.1 phosphoesterase [Clostridium aceticum]KJF27336.1 phosphoesterase [Clostridium aceticum]
MHIRNRKIRISLTIVMIGLIITLFCIWQNNDIITTQIDYSNFKIPSEFNGYTIVQVSDLHNKKFGKNQEPLLKKIQAVSPDIIVVTGDLIDRRKYDLDTAMVFINGAMKIAPVYYVSGNHEAWSGDYKNISQKLLSSGVQILDDSKVRLIKEEAMIEILGLSDPDFLTSSYINGTNSSKLEEQLIHLSDDSVFQILLSHRPELFDLYANENIDIIFSGHAHGGQFRIPFIGGLVAPDQGLFPKYTSGIYTKNQSTLIVSRGLGNSIIPVRIFNRPEIVVVTIHNER